MNILFSFLLMVAAPEPLVCDDPGPDVGEIRAGAAFRHVFVVRNASRETIRLTDLGVTCDCHKREISKKLLAPGESANITLDWNTLSMGTGKALLGAQLRYSVGIDATPGELPLAVKAKIVREIELNATAFSLPADAKEPSVITLKDTRAKPFRIVEVKSVSPERLSVEWKADATKAGVWRIDIRPGAQIPTGTHREGVIVRTDDPVYPTLTIPVTVRNEKRAAVESTPNEVSLRLIKGKATVSGLVQLRAANGQEIEIEKVEASDGRITARFSSEKGAVGTVRVIVEPRGSDLDGEASGTLTIHFREPAAATVTIPVKWRKGDN